MKQSIMIIIPTLEFGGAERYAVNLSKQLIKDFNVYFAVFDTQKGRFTPKGTVINVNLPAQKGLISKVLNVFKRRKHIERLVKEHNIDIIYSITEAANRINVMIKSDCKKYLSVRGYGSFKAFGKKHSRQIDKVNGIIYNSKELACKFIKKYNVNPNKVFHQYNIFDYELINELTKDEVTDLPNDFFTNNDVIVTSSRICYEKGHWHLIKIFEIIRYHKHNAKLLILGNTGSFETDIKNLAQQSKYNNDIIFMGFQENPFKYIARSACFVMTSISEGFPNALVEALMCDVPVVSTACKTGPQEILNKDFLSISPVDTFICADYGILTPELSPQVNLNLNEKQKEHYDFANAVIKVLDNDNIRKRYSNLGGKINARFDKDNMYNILLEIFDI